MIRFLLCALLALSLTGCTVFSIYPTSLTSARSSGMAFSAKSDPNNRRSYIIFANGEAVARKNEDGGISGSMSDGRKVWAICDNKLIGMNILILPSFDTICTVYLDGTEVGNVYPN